MKHYITKYRENDKLIVESWLQINFLKWNWCFSKRKLVINKNNSKKSDENIEILNEDNYTRLIVESEKGEKIAEVTLTDATPAEGYLIRLTPKYDSSVDDWLADDWQITD